MSGRRDQQDRGPKGRTEPTLGSLDHLDAPPEPRDSLPHVKVDPMQRRTPPPARPGAESRKRGWLLPLLLLLVIAAITLVWLQQDRLRGLLPSTELNDVLSRADKAFADGKLDGSDGTSARELFEAARDQQPDNDRARDGLRRVGQAEIARADAALSAKRYDEADAALSEARELLGGGSDVERLGQQLAQARNPQTQTETLVDQAQQAFAAGKLDGDDGAGALYKRVLDADSANTVAARGLDKVGDGLAAQAREALANNDKATASARVERIAALVPGYGDLPSLRAALAETKKQDNEALTQLLAQGGDDMRAGRFTGDGDDNALARFRAALAIDPDNADARAGLGQVAQALLVQANAALDGNDNEQAAHLLEQAAVLAPKSAELAAAKARLGGAAHSDGVHAQEDAAPAPILTPAQSAQVGGMIKRAQAAASRGDVMTPPGDSAYDLYRGALSIDGNNETARAGLQALPAVVERQFNLALSGKDLVKADDLLNTLNDLAPGESDMGDLRRHLASAWIDQAIERNTAGDRTSASQALQRARQLAPDDPRLQDAYSRLPSGR
jgi:tetratricopeptide (TPR) repeat protein